MKLFMHKRESVKTRSKRRGERSLRGNFYRIRKCIDLLSKIQYKFLFVIYCCQFCCQISVFVVFVVQRVWKFVQMLRSDEQTIEKWIFGRGKSENALIRLKHTRAFYGRTEEKTHTQIYRSNTIDYLLPFIIRFAVDDGASTKRK